MDAVETDKAEASCGITHVSTLPVLSQSYRVKFPSYFGFATLFKRRFEDVMLRGRSSQRLGKLVGLEKGVARNRTRVMEASLVVGCCLPSALAVHQIQFHWCLFIIS
jgi:hypothetical protein